MSEWWVMLLNAMHEALSFTFRNDGKFRFFHLSLIYVIAKTKYVIIVVSIMQGRVFKSKPRDKWKSLRYVDKRLSGEPSGEFLSLSTLQKMIWEWHEKGQHSL